MPAFASLLPGDPAPWFHQRTSGNDRFAFDSVAGRYIVLCLFGTAGDARGRAAIDAVLARRGRLDDDHACFFGVSLDPADEQEGRVADSMPGIRYFWDRDGTIGRLYGAVPTDFVAGQADATGRRLWVVIGPSLRVLKVVPFTADGSDAVAVLDYLEALPPPDRLAGFPVQAPVLILPDVFEPALCARLIAVYEAQGGQESGFMREVDGKTVAMHDARHKKRRDVLLADQELIAAVQARILRRVVPEILKVHQFQVTRMERYLVACYAAEEGGHFRAHRDNTTKGTAHRRFAVSVNLNDAFTGGEVGFPEYGPRGYKMGAGGAVVFSCSLLHQVSAVTSGRRYAFLPFLYDDAAARLREANNRHLGEGVGGYKA